MRHVWGIGLAASLALAGCDLPGAGPVDLSSKSLDPAQRSELAELFRDLLSAQQAHQQVNVTSSALIADNSAGLLSNNASSLTRSAPMLAAQGGGLISNNGSTYRLAVARDQGPNRHQVLPDGNHFYRLGDPTIGSSLVETFVTALPNSAVSGFHVEDGAILVHARMTVTLGDFDPVTELFLPVTNRYAIEVLKSPVFEAYQSEVRITAPPLGKTQQYVSTARYTLGSLPVTAESTHSAFVTFGKGEQAVDLPTAGEERIQIGDTLLQLSYQNVSGRGVGIGSWTRAHHGAYPLTYTYDFTQNLAQMRVSLPQERDLRLTVRPGMRIEAGDALDAAGETVASLAKREDGAIVLRFKEGDEVLLFE